MFFTAMAYGVFYTPFWNRDYEIYQGRNCPTCEYLGPTNPLVAVIVLGVVCCIFCCVAVLAVVQRIRVSSGNPYVPQ